MGGPSAPTPAPHTPVSYLESGGSAFFSALCQQLLIDACLNPDWFGSYDHAHDNYTAPAAAKAKEWDDAAKAGKPPPPGDPPTPNEKFLATCQSGHMVHDASQREPGAINRGDPCANTPSGAGYIEGRAPAVPMETVAGEPNCVHHAFGREEDKHLANKDDPVQRRADQHARVDTFLERHKERYPQQYAKSQAAAGGSAPALGAAGSADRSKALGAKPPQQPTGIPPEAVVNGETDAECIKNWLDKAEQEMRTSGLDKEIAEHEKLCKVKPPNKTREEQQDELARTGAAKMKAAEDLEKTSPNSPEAKKARAEADQAADRSLLYNDRMQALGCLQAQRAALGR